MNSFQRQLAKWGFRPIAQKSAEDEREAARILRVSKIDDDALYDILRAKGMLREKAWDECCPDGNRCSHINAEGCKQARLVFDHRQGCPNCECFSRSRGIPPSARKHE